MIAQEVAGRYARAFFGAVRDKNLIDVTHEQVEGLNTIISKQPEMMKFLNSPQVPESDQKALIRDVFGSRMEQLLVEFLIVLVEKNRFNFLPEIMDEFRRQVEAHNGIGRVTVITALKLEETERSELISRLGTKTGLKIVLEEKVDPRIIGGMIVVMYNEIIDGSVRYGLEKVEEQLAHLRVH